MRDEFRFFDDKFDDEPEASAEAMDAPSAASAEGSNIPVEERLAEAQKELDRIDKRLRELRLTVQRVKEESERLGQQSASIIVYLKQAMRRGHTQDVLKGYETALETQKRHLIMRGQVESLENQRNSLEMYRERLVQYIEALEQLAALQGQGGQRGATPDSVELVKMVIAAEERVRRRLARQVHDGPAQALANFILQADIAYRLFESNPEEAGKELDNLRRAANTTFQQVRAFIAELRPLTLDDLGLSAAIQRYLQMVEKRYDVRTTLQQQGAAPPKLARHLQMLLFRAVQEAVTRAVLYGHAKQVEIVLDFQPQQIFMRLQADSRRWPQEEEAADERAEADEALRLLREQVEILGGSLVIGELEAAEGEFVELLLPVVAEE